MVELFIEIGYLHYNKCVFVKTQNCLLYLIMIIIWSFQGEELRQRLRELEERERREGKKMADEEALRKIRSVEEQIDILNKKLSIAKQVCHLLILFARTNPLFYFPFFL